jgi:hypothetical protein
MAWFISRIPPIGSGKGFGVAGAVVGEGATVGVAGAVVGEGATVGVAGAVVGEGATVGVAGIVVVEVAMGAVLIVEVGLFGSCTMTEGGELRNAAAIVKNPPKIATTTAIFPPSDNPLHHDMIAPLYDIIARSVPALLVFYQPSMVSQEANPYP